MLQENEVLERMKYCYLVYRQLGWLYTNSMIAPPDYVSYLKSSSLRLGEDDFIMESMQEATRFGEIEEALRELLSFYEGMAYALAAVLEIPIANMEDLFPNEELILLAREMGVSR
ncbi:MAG: hypothetical protein K9K75_01705 [Deltaproteobacteria bacterium]|nr:hypothetical protein [Deltaproteobacteria bacterium]